MAEHVYYTDHHNPMTLVSRKKKEKSMLEQTVQCHLKRDAYLRLQSHA